MRVFFCENVPRQDRQLGRVRARQRRTDYRLQRPRPCAPDFRSDRDAMARETKCNGIVVRARYLAADAVDVCSSMDRRIPEYQEALLYQQYVCENSTVPSLVASYARASIT
jgi:hypothetical protein